MSVTSTSSVAAAATSNPGASEPNVLRRWLNSPWLYVCLALPIASYFILRWARTSPGYDPYGWLTWGYQTLHGSLDLKGAPSWKPITYVFTLPYSLAGHYSWWLWRVTSLSLSLGGPIAGGVLAHRLVRRDDESVWPAVVAALFAGIGICMIVQYWHYILSSQSDSILVTFVLVALNQLLSKRYGWAVTFLAAAGLGRPEAWIILGPVMLWVLVTQPQLRRLVLAEIAVMIFLWFIVPVISGAPWDIAQKLAQHSVRELHSNKFFGTIQRYLDLTLWPVLVTAAGTFVWAILRRDRWVVGLALVPILWMVVELWFVLSNGFPGVPRYMFEAAATTIVLAAVGIGWLTRIALGSAAGILAHETLENDGRRLRGAAGGAGSGAAGSGGGAGSGGAASGGAASGGAASGGGTASGGAASPVPARVAAAVIALVMIGFMVPYAKHAWDYEHTDILAERNRTHSIYELSRTIDAAGGATFIKSCGTPTIDVGTASILAWYTHSSTAHIGYIPKKQIASGAPTVLFTGLFNGFVIHTYNLPAGAVQRCAVLNNAYYLETAGHPDGEFFHLSH
jgi:hypothetical protein